MEIILNVSVGRVDQLILDPAQHLPGFDLLRRQWSFLNHFHTGRGICAAVEFQGRFRDNPLCRYGQPQTMTHIVDVQNDSAYFLEDFVHH